MTSYAITEDMLRDTTAAHRAAGARVLGETFDSHDVIRLLMREHPQEYASDLYSHVTSEDPIKTLHGDIGKRLAGLGTLIPIRKVLSANVRGEQTENQEWRRLTS